MPILKSSKKRAKQDQRKRERNQGIKRQTKTSIGKLKELINQGKNEEVKKSLPSVVSLIDKAVSKGVWHKNKAAREKSKLMRKSIR